jgi:hypothetical protein
LATPLRPATGQTQYAVSSDGQRFLVIEPIVEPAKPMTVVLNWQEELKQRVPTR